MPNTRAPVPRLAVPPLEASSRHAHLFCLITNSPRTSSTGGCRTTAKLLRVPYPPRPRREARVSERRFRVVVASLPRPAQVPRSSRPRVFHLSPLHRLASPVTSAARKHDAGAGDVDPAPAARLSPRACWPPHRALRNGAAPHRAPRRIVTHSEASPFHNWAFQHRRAQSGPPQGASAAASSPSPTGHRHPPLGSVEPESSCLVVPLRKLSPGTKAGGRGGGAAPPACWCVGAGKPHH